jgi:hypothetical protein
MSGGVMAVKKAQTGALDLQKGRLTKIPPPVPEGTDHLEGLGRLVDNLLGDSRYHRQAEEYLAPITLRDEEMNDPEPLDPPPTVDDGSEEIRKGDEPQVK